MIQTSSSLTQTETAAIDLGTTKTNVAVLNEGVLTTIRFPHDGEQIVSAVYIDPDGTKYVGRDAELRSWKHPENFHTCFKPGLLDRPHEPMAGGITRFQLTVILIEHLIKQLLTRLPHLKGYPQFGGSTSSAEQLKLVVTIPFGWSLEQQELIKEAFRMAGVDVDAGSLTFAVEPKAAGYHLLRQNGHRTRNQDKILVLDLGGGTFDVSLLRFENGTLHEHAAPLGDPQLGGRNYTAALAVLISDKLKLNCSPAFDQIRGLSLDQVSDAALRETALEIWRAADDTKCRFATSDEVSAFIQTPNGKREVQLTLVEAQSAWAPLWERMEQVLTTAMREGKIEWTNIAHIFLVGGSAMLPSIRSRIAKLAGRSESEILVSADSSSVVVKGAAEFGLYGNHADQALVSGFGVRLVGEHRSLRNKVLLRPNHIIPAAGQLVEHLGQCIETSGGGALLAVRPFICKPGVRCAEPTDAMPVYLDEREILELAPVSVNIDLPAGEHAVSATIAIDAHRETSLVLTPLNLPGYEPIVLPMRLDGGQIRGETIESSALNVALIVDCSKSMEGEKLTKAKQAGTAFAKAVMDEGVTLALVALGGSAGSRVVYPWGRDVDALRNSLNQLDSFGGTPIDESLKVTAQHFDSADVSNQKLVVLISDGLPDSSARAFKQAKLLKQRAVIACIGIGDKASRAVLEQIATKPEYYFYSETADQILNCLWQVAELIDRRLPTP